MNVDEWWPFWKYLQRAASVWQRSIWQKQEDFPSRWAANSKLMCGRHLKLDLKQTPRFSLQVAYVFQHVVIVAWASETNWEIFNPRTYPTTNRCSGREKERRMKRERRSERLATAHKHAYRRTYVLYEKLQTSSRPKHQTQNSKSPDDRRNRWLSASRAQTQLRPFLVPSTAWPDPLTSMKSMSPPLPDPRRTLKACFCMNRLVNGFKSMALPFYGKVKSRMKKTS